VVGDFEGDGVQILGAEAFAQHLAAHGVHRVRRFGVIDRTGAPASRPSCA